MGPDRLVILIWCRRRAAELGPAVVELVEGLLERHALHHLRAAQGVIGLADKHGPQRLDAACRRAIDAGDPAYRTVRGILATRLETAPVRGRRRRVGGDAGASARPSWAARPPRRRRRCGGGSVTAPNAAPALEAALRTLKLPGMADMLGDRLAQAAAGGLGHAELLALLVGDEQTRRDSAGLSRRLGAAHFEQTCAVEDFDFAYNPDIPVGLIRDLAGSGS